MTNTRTALVALAMIAASAPAHSAVTISTAATENVTCSGGVCAPTAAKAVLNVADLENLLSSGNVTVTTAGAGVDANDIRIETALGWSATALDLKAGRSVVIDQPVSVQNQGGLSLTTGHRKEPGGSLFFGSHGSVTFADPRSAFSTNRVKYTLVNSIATLASAVLANPDGNYALANSYDASGDGTYSASPVPTTYGGIFEGLGNAISNLSINDSSDGSVGLFANVMPGTLRDVSLTDANVTGPPRYAGVGALVAGLVGNLINDSVSGSVSSETQSGYVGGIVGYAGPGLIMGCSSSANVSAANGAAGGIAGYAYEITEFSGSRATGNVSGYFAGGLAGGTNYSQITTSFATGTVEGNEVGGLVEDVGSGTIANSYATGLTETLDHRSGNVGGLVGYLENGSVASASYSAGRVHGGGYKSTGGFAGVVVDGTLSSDYWDTSTSGKKQGVGNEKNAPGVTGLTTQQLQSGLPTGFDPKIWAEDASINNGLPYLIANPPPK
ncbi:MAG TPA: GLUG motif-containing protein [Rhizomicrobium sp.]|nr:GLUG motif-containing protein [Rhizomicrobium sp.]